MQSLLFSPDFENLFADVAFHWPFAFNGFFNPFAACEVTVQ